MVTLKHGLVLTTTLACILAVEAGCTVASDTYITAQAAPEAPDAKGAETKGTTTTSTTAGTTSGAPKNECGFEKVDLSTLTACGNNRGHCVPKERAPMADALTACPNAAEVCVPDNMIAAAGDKVKSCKSLGDLAGACVTYKLLPDIEAKGGSVLPADVCDPDQKCAPCVNPQDQKNTGLCDATGVKQAKCEGGATSSTPDAGPPAPPPPACCTTNGKSNGSCIDEKLIPADKRAETKLDTCSAGNKCVPTSFFQLKPVACNNEVFGKGVCLDKCFDDMLAGIGSVFLGKDVCGETELCLPCSLASGRGIPSCP